MKTLIHNAHFIAASSAVLISIMVTLPIMAAPGLSNPKTQQQINEQASRLALQQQVIYFEHEVELEAKFDIQLDHADKQFVRKICASHDLEFDNKTATCMKK
ncbi:hypothetical protein ACFOD0_04585 [Shewanella intestini]|uniref:Uncharacterized protein n=1 Tax=Shewanella intestini TaxID=2017544 RepID=A0ABS5I2J9_9GAMM|nr:MULTISPECIES: hypothetical protein [Shewanella]MBR9727580.1 hypothetical protein [Shewanella intestini]MRG35270.1 hypothetical protein [Shewanella sp. XMDDZSB0408]